MKGSARAHPIQGLVKYHGLRNTALNVPYHDSISVCTAPSETRTTVEFGYDTDTCHVDGSAIDAEGYERVTTVIDHVRKLSGVDSHARVVSENNFESNIGLGASASAFAALALAAATAVGLDLSRSELSALARRGATSAARSVTGGFSHLHTSMSDEDCIAERVPDSFDEDIRIVVGVVSKYKLTSRAHTETPQSHLFQGRLAHIHNVLVEMREAIQNGNFESTFALAERDSLNLLAVTMTGPEGWVYWQPETLKLLRLARRLRETGIPVYFSSDTGATAYLNTTAEYAEEVSDEVEALDIESRIWHIGGRAEKINGHLF
ncbi:GHMP family kinase ATP-binding protein [Haladaptatus halobius]|uniref:GHMP family kinase ATP-binding protein n=1 Tax=Haladaptatus halobius TaxID=2884875 RepID=UPI001D0B8E1C|nr:diphosphomevalonate decarboxylase [Haladaptatus halobius]